MDYEKKYRESMAKMSTFLAKHDGFTISKDGEIYKELSEIFPELAESNDEMIRKDIVEAVELHKDFTQGRKERIYAWLEKQKSEEINVKALLTADKLAAAEMTGRLKERKDIVENPQKYGLENQGEHAKFRDSIQVGDKVTRNRDGMLVNLSQLKRVAKPAENKGEHDMGISKATKQELEDNLNKALEKETPESFNEFLDEQDEQNPADNTDKLKEEYQKGWDAAMLQLPKEVDSQIWQIANNSAKTWDESFAILCATQKAYDKGKKDALKEQNSTWSEEDEKMLKACTELVGSTICANYGEEDGVTIESCRNWLKSLKERYTWKPSDLPHWKKSNLPNDNVTGFNSDYFCHKGYGINYKELFDKLPKDD